MATGNARDTIFSATLSPHRSLGSRGFLALMLAFGGLWLAVSAYFWALGAWPRNAPPAKTRMANTPIPLAALSTITFP